MKLALLFYILSILFSALSFGMIDSRKKLALLFSVLGFVFLVAPVFQFSLGFRIWAGLVIVVSFLECLKFRKNGLWSIEIFSRATQYYALTSIAGVSFFLFIEAMTSVNQVPDEQSYWLIKAIAALLILDFKNYIFHYLQHKVDFWWRFHSIHHAPTEIISLSVAQAHILEWLLTSHMANIFILWALNFSIDSIIIYQYFIFTIKVFTHTPFRTPSYLSWLRFVVVTPDYHRVHHSRSFGQRKNFGELLTVWDRIFGTSASFSRIKEPQVLGLENSDLHKMSIWEQQIYPFKRLEKK
jgi:sterol desaturase/sphingolipid hydroxylase (fatty acid hydroxylase superfamily)